MTAHAERRGAPTPYRVTYQPGNIVIWLSDADESAVADVYRYSDNWDAALALAYQMAATPLAFAALSALAMRQFTADGTYCWCDGPVYDGATHQHDPECVIARAALDAARAPERSEVDGDGR